MSRMPWADLLARFILVLTLCAMSWAFGGAGAQAKAALATAVSGLVVLTMLTAPSRGLTSRALPTIWALLGLAVGIGFVQLAPLGVDTVDAVSPASNVAKQEMGISSASDMSTLSLSQAGTRHDLALLCLAAAIFCLGSQLFQTVGSQIFLCFAIAINGAALAGWGLFQQIGGRHELLPGFGGRDDSIIFSTYVNHSSAAGYLNMCLGAAFGLLLWRYRAIPRQVSRYGRSPGSTTAALRSLLRGVTPDLFLVGLMAIAMSIGLVASLSRGGCLAAVAAFAVLVLLAMRRKRFSKPLIGMVCVGCVGIAAIVWLGFSRPLADRYSRMAQSDVSAADGRLSHWRDGFRASGEFLTLGSGLGTYRHVYPLSRLDDNPHWFYHAHNQYLESLVEGGAIGLACLLGCLMLVSIGVWHLSTRAEVGVHSWFGIATAFAVVSQAVHAMTDFGLYLPANMGLFALMCGAASGTAATTRSSSWLRLPRVLSYPAAWNILLFAGCLFATSQLYANLSSRSVLEETNGLQRVAGRPTLEFVDAEIAALEKAQAITPYEADLSLRLAKKYLLRFQVQRFDELRSTEALQAISSQELWEQSSIERVHAHIAAFTPNKRKTAAAELRGSRLAQDNLAPARKFLLESRRHGPFRPTTHVYLGMLAPLFDEDDIVHLNRAQRLAVAPETNFVIGLLHLRRGRREQGIARWKACLKRTRTQMNNILAVGPTVLPESVIVAEILPDDPRLLLRMAQRLRRKAPTSKTVATLARRVDDIASSSKVEDLPERDYYRGAAALLLKKAETAAQHLERAVSSQPTRTEWRYHYASALTELGDVKAAQTQLRVCLNLEPRNGKYRRLMRTLQSGEQTHGL